MKKIVLQFICMLALAVALPGLVSAQSVTTATITGIVEDEAGAPLPGATVIAVHTPSGTKYGTSTLPNGRYTLANVRVGGPYIITTSFVGFEDQIKEGVNLSIGQNLFLKYIMQEGGMQLDEIQVSAERNDILNSDRTGAETKIGKEQIQTLPTIDRDINDFARLTPQASLKSSGGISVAGSNNRFNAIYIDGAVNNDVFGLAGSGTNGGQVGISPISLDAIESIQVVVAPYDVRLGGFGGGGINAVTRSGTNNVEGSVYWLTRNESFVGKTPTFGLGDRERTKVDEFKFNLYGFRVGAPIIKDKLFIFVNGEIERRETPTPFDFNQYNDGTDPSRSTRQDFVDLSNFLQNTYNYNPGGFEDVIDEVNSDKLFARLDWNINDDHRLTLRHSYTLGESTSPSNSSNGSINYGNGGVFFPSTTNSTALELNSRFGNTLANNLIIGYTTVRDDRDPIGSDFPNVRIIDGSGSLRFGSERFSTANTLDQDVFTITNNLTLFKGAHTVTFGTHNEFYKINNVFIRRNYSEYVYNSIDDFVNGVAPGEYRRQYSLVDDVTGDETAAAAAFNAFQLGFYIQDEWYVNEKLKLTGGLRFDIPVYADDPAVDQNFNDNALPLIQEYWDVRGAQVGQAPETQVLFSPRFGFNWDIKGDQTTQLRGGLGIFNSRQPFVWVGGAYNNNGVSLNEVRIRGNSIGGGAREPITFPNGNPVPFEPNVNNQYTRADFNQPTEAGGQIDLFASDLKLPQLFRASLAIDQQLPWGIVATLEGLYSKTVNNITYVNLNSTPATGVMNPGQVGDNRPIYGDGSIAGDYSDVLLGFNTNKGYTWNFTAQLRRPFANGFDATVAYNYGTAQVLNDGTSSQNSSQWRFNENVNGLNYLGLTRSNFDPGHRVLASLSYGISYAKYFRSTISLFYNGQSGVPFSYVYSDNINLEDFSNTNLIYVPRSFEEANLVDFTGSNGTISAQDQWIALNRFIEQDDYLRSRRGQYAERNGDRTPFEHIIDLQFLQDVIVNIGESKNTLQFSLNIFNFTNMLNKDWGRQYFVSNDSFSLITVDSDGQNPTYNFFDPSNNQPYQIDDSGTSSSRWQMQIGLRYIFN